MTLSEWWQLAEHSTPIARVSFCKYPHQQENYKVDISIILQPPCRYLATLDLFLVHQVFFWNVFKRNVHLPTNRQSVKKQNNNYIDTESILFHFCQTSNIVILINVDTKMSFCIGCPLDYGLTFNLNPGFALKCIYFGTSRTVDIWI